MVEKEFCSIISWSLFPITLPINTPQKEIFSQIYLASSSLFFQIKACWKKNVLMTSLLLTTIQYNTHIGNTYVFFSLWNFTQWKTQLQSRNVFLWKLGKTWYYFNHSSTFIHTLNWVWIILGLGRLLPSVITYTL